MPTISCRCPGWHSCCKQHYHLKPEFAFLRDAGTSCCRQTLSSSSPRTGYCQRCVCTEPACCSSDTATCAFKWRCTSSSRSCQCLSVTVPPACRRSGATWACSSRGGGCTTRSTSRSRRSCCTGALQLARIVSRTCAVWWSFDGCAALQLAAWGADAFEVDFTHVRTGQFCIVPIACNRGIDACGL